MDDSRVVCAETLEWVAYGPCGHREVCSTCVIRLRFICKDCHCCLCKTHSDVIFVTKALGDNTRIIKDFSAFPTDPTEGKVGVFWYHEGTQAFFDDLDLYKMVKAMCRPSCTICDKLNEQRKKDSKGGVVEMKSIEQLRSHLFNKHKLFMCTSCLEGRKVFICEQKLYTKEQLSQHIKTGDLKVDGRETERGGFMGHPTCEFCQDPFYGDNELYLHMNTEHFTCHICQRHHPGQYEYYRSYNDMEMHFRQKHFLCEDEACLAKTFIVFANKPELKKHNIIEHGQHISRSKRRVALQIPTSFRFRPIDGQDQHGRNDGSHPDILDNQHSSAVEGSLATAISETVPANPSNARTLSGHGVTTAVHSFANPFEALSRSNPETSSSRCTDARRQSFGHVPLDDSFFPPLPVTSTSSHWGSGNATKRSVGETTAAHLRHLNRGTVKILNSSRAQSAANYQPNSSPHNSNSWKSLSDSGFLSSSSSCNSSVSKSRMVNGYVASTTSAAQDSAAFANGISLVNSQSCSVDSHRISKIDHSASAPSLVGEVSIASQIRKAPKSNSSQKLPKVEDVQSAKKALMVKIRAALESDENYLAFKNLSADYGKDIITTVEYLAYVHEFGLSHLVLELARLCSNPRKQKELVETYNFNLKGLAVVDAQLKKNNSKKGKEKWEDGSIDSLINYKHSGNGKSKVLVDGSDSVSYLFMDGNDSQSLNGDDSKKNMGTVGGENKPRKKTSKFLGNRLGDMSKAEVSNPSKDDRGLCPIEDKKNENNEQDIWLNLVGKSSNSTQLGKLPASGSSHNLPKVEDIQSANKDVVGKIRAALESEEVYLAFKLVSADYRKDLITTEEYLAYVHQFGLSYLVPDLARLCRNPRKEKELVETYNFNLRGVAFQHAQLKKKSSRKGKEKCDSLINHKTFGNG